MKKTTNLMTKIRKQAWLPLLLALAFLLQPAGSGLALPPATVVVDPFTAEQCAGQVCAPPAPVVADAATLGGERDVLARPIAGTSALRVWGTAWPGLSVENGPPDGLSTYLISWDGPDGDATSIDPDGLGVDLLAGCQAGSAYFSLRQTYLDRQAAYTLTVYSGAGNRSTWFSGAVDRSEALFLVPLDEFTVAAGSGADWHDVGAITLAIDTNLTTTADLSLAPFKFGCTPTAVDLLRFEAAYQGDAVLVEWETATESDNVGFHLYRATSVHGPRTRLNEGLIPSQAPGAIGGAVYTWLDEGVTPGTTYYYWLEDVDVYGVVTLHGPVQAEATAPAFELTRSQPER